jgi:hypothetical protein
MRNSFKTLSVFSLLLLATVASIAQTSVEKHHHLLSMHHQKAQDDHNNVAQHKTAKPEFRRKEAKDARIHIDAARATHREMLKTDTPEKSATAQEHHKALAKYHEEAAKHNDALNKELSKPDPDEQKVQEHINAVKQSLDEAEKENQA